MKLKRIVAVAMVIFGVIVLFYWVTGIWFPGKPPSQQQKIQSELKAYKNGLFDKPSPAIIHHNK